MRAGAALGEKDARGGYSALHLAADAGQCEAIVALARAGAPLELRSAKGWTPLALATLKVRVMELQVEKLMLCSIVVQYW